MARRREVGVRAFLLGLLLVAVPTLVQHVMTPSNAQFTGGSGTTTPFYFLSGSKSGNFLMMVIVTSNTVSLVADDQSQTWTQSLSASDGTGFQGYIYTRKATAAGVQKVTVTFGSAVSADGTSVVLSEWFNVDATTPVHLTTSSQGTSATWTAGSFSPSSGDLVYNFAVNTTQSFSTPAALSLTTTFTAGTNFSLESNDNMLGQAAQSWVSTGGAVNPTLTAPASTTFFSLGIALTPSASAQGADGAAFRAKRLSVVAACTLVPGTTVKYGLPCDGNLLLAATSMTSSPAIHISSITGSGGNFTELGGSPIAQGASTSALTQGWHADNITPSRTFNGTITWTGIPSAGTTMWFVEIVGAATSPLDATATGGSGFTNTAGGMTSSGTQSVAGNLTVGSITPSGSNEIIFVYVDHAAGSETGISSPAGGAFLVPYQGQNGGAGAWWTTDAGAVLITTGSAATFTFTHDTDAVLDWSAVGAAYKAAPTGPTVSVTGALTPAGALGLNYTRGPLGPSDTMAYLHPAPENRQALQIGPFA